VKSINKLILFSFLALSGLAFAFLTSIKFLINFAHDDSFFYLKTAYNFSAGYGSTFDLVNETNGYHPLWFLILSLYFFLLNFFVNFSPAVYFRFVVLLNFLICVLILYLVFKIFKIKKSNEEYRKQYFLFIPLFIILVFTRDFGIESQLSCMLFSIYLLLKSKEVFEDKNYIALKIILLNLLFLSRIDYLFTIVPFIIISDYYTSETKRKLKFLLCSIISILIISCSYFLFNKFTYGHFLTITASLKNTFPNFLLFENLKMITSHRSLVIHFIKSALIVVVILLFLLSLKYKKRNITKVDLFLFGSGGGVLSFIILSLSFNAQALREWYVTFPTFVAGLLFIYSINFAKKFFSLKLGFLIILCAIYFYLVRMNNFKWNSSYDYAINLKRVTDEQDKIFQIDFSGVVGYFSERKIINGDGLINSFEYWDYLKGNNLDKYFKAKRINMYSTHSEDDKYYQIADSSGIFTDKFFSNRFGGYPFQFSAVDIVYMMPFDYDHILYKAKGSWYLFKIPE